MTPEEIMKHVRIGHAVATLEICCDVLAQHAHELDPALAQRVVDSIAKYGDARRAMVALQLAPAASNARN